MKDFFQSSLHKWKLYLLSVIICCGLGALIILSQENVYQREMSVLIKDNETESPAQSMSKALSSFGFGGSSTNVNNELISITSPAIMSEVIQRLQIDVDYHSVGLLKEVTLYGTTLPFHVEFLDLKTQDAAGFKLSYNDNGSVSLSDFYKLTEDEKHAYEQTSEGRIDGSIIRTPIGRISITPNSQYAPTPKQRKRALREINVDRMGLQAAIEFFSGETSADLADQDAEVIDISVRDVSTQRACDMLDQIITVYNENWIKDKNKVAQATSAFIDDRLQVIERELGHVDSDISEFKSAHLIADLREAAKLSMQQGAELSSEMLSVSNELAMATSLRDYVSNPANRENVIPVNTGIKSAQLETQIVNYNNLLLARNSLQSNSSASNPIVQDYNSQLRGLRESIVRSISNQVSTLQAAMQNYSGAHNRQRRELASGPTQARQLLSIERQQKVKESLYLFLLEKREENELTQKFTADNTRIITPPTGSLKPIAPRKMMIMVIALLLGVCIPALIIYVTEAANSKVRNRRDLDRMVTPLLGEIPLARTGGRNRFLSKLFTARRDREPLERVESFVKPGSRDAVSESFRIIRGNIDFMVKNDSQRNLLMITSMNPGSGKSFISYNLAASFALKNKRVLLIDGDLRHGSASQFIGMPTKGMTNWLNGDPAGWMEYVKEERQHPGLFILPIGHRPPNPSELLDNGRLKQLLEEARKEFDYVIIDCPPIDIVVDTQIIAAYADRTLVVVRAGLLDRSALAEIDSIYQQKRFKQMCVILNGTEIAQSRIGNYGSYGYYGS